MAKPLTTGRESSTSNRPSKLRVFMPRVLRRILRVVIIGGLTIFMTGIALEAGFRLVPQTIPLGACKSSLTLAHSYCEYNYQYDDPLRLGYIFNGGYAYDGPWNPADPAVVDAVEETCGDWPDHTFDYHFKADSKGFVNNAEPWQDHYDVVITGDSFTRPWSSEWWVDILRAQTGMSVLNLGMDGWATLAEIEAIRLYGLDKTPDWVILMYFEGNDLFGVGEYARRRDSGLDWRAYQLQQVGWADRLIVPHVLGYWGDELWAKIDPPESEPCRYPMTVATNVNRFDTIFYTVHISQLSAQREEIEVSREWELATGAIRDLRNEVEAQGGRFLLVYIPAKEHLYWSRLWEEDDIGHFLELTTPLRSYAEFSEHLDDQMVLMEEFAAANDVELLNLSSALWERTIHAGQAYYNFADVHWNNEGNQLVADLIGDYITASSP